MKMMSHWRLMGCILLMGCTGQTLVAEVLEGSTASEWVRLSAIADDADPSRPVTADGTWLHFIPAPDERRAEWLLSLDAREAGADWEKQYVIVTYKAKAVQSLELHFIEDGGAVRAVRDVHRFVHRGARHWAQGPVTEGGPHEIAVDLSGLHVADPISALKIALTFESERPADLRARIAFRNDLPDTAETLLLQLGSVPENHQRMEVRFTETEWRVASGETAAQASPTPNGQRFRAVRPQPGHENAISQQEEVDLGIAAERSTTAAWQHVLPHPLDVSGFRHYVIGYRAKGYSRAADQDSLLVLANEREQRLPLLFMGDVVADGEWRWFRGIMPVRQDAPYTRLDLNLPPSLESLELTGLILSSEVITIPLARRFDYEMHVNEADTSYEPIPVPREMPPVSPHSQARLLLGDWFSHTDIQVEDVPFQVPARLEDVPFTLVQQSQTLTCPLPENAREVYILLAADFPYRELFHTRTLGAFDRQKPLPQLDEPERMTFAISYRDGTVDEHIPRRVRSDAVGVCHGLDLYVVPVRPDTPPEQLVLNDRMRNAAFGLVGVTVRTSTPRHQPLPSPTDWYTPSTPAPASRVEMEMPTNGPLVWGSLAADFLPEPVSLSHSPLFRIRLSDTVLDSTAFVITNRTECARAMRLEAVDTTHGLRAVCTATRVAPDAYQLSLSLYNEQDDPVRGALEFPYLRDLVLGSPDDTWYFMPRMGGVIHRAEGFWREPWGEKHPLQLNAFFNPRDGYSLGFIGTDQSGIFRWHSLSKNKTGITYAIEYPSQSVPPGGQWEAAETHLTIRPGDWRAAYRRYLSFKADWYDPAVPRKPWFREIFAFQGIGTNLNMPVARRSDLAAIANEARAELGFCDFIHIYGWATNPDGPLQTMYGDHRRLDAYGGPAFKEHVRISQAAGIPVGFYTNPHLAHPDNTRPGMDLIEEAGIRAECGNLMLVPAHQSYRMCPGAPGWREHFIGDLSWLARQFSEEDSAYYLDQFGSNWEGLTCHAATHDHPEQAKLAPCEPNFIQAMRAAIPAAIPLYSEMAAADSVSQFLDGGYSHAVWYGYWNDTARFAPHNINFHRFALPDYKLFEKCYYLSHRNGNWHLLKQVLFNGLGLCQRESSVNNDPAARDFKRRMFALLHDYAPAFNSTDVEPLLPVDYPGIYINRFSGPEYTLWMVYNSGYSTVRGRIFRVATQPDMQYRDVWNKQAVTAHVDGPQTALAFSVGPRSLAAILAENLPSRSSD